MPRNDQLQDQIEKAVDQQLRDKLKTFKERLDKVETQRDAGKAAVELEELRKKYEAAQAEIAKLREKLARLVGPPSGGARFKASNGAVATVFERNRVKNEMMDFVVVTAYEALQKNDACGALADGMEDEYGGTWDVFSIGSHDYCMEVKNIFIRFYMYEVNFVINGSLEEEDEED